MTQRSERVRIVPFETRHIPACAELERACFSDPWSEEMIREELGTGLSTYLAAEDGDTFLGYIGMQQILDEGYITNVAVEPRYRRYGVGTRLVEELIDLAKAQDLRFVSLEVRVSNAPAIQLYERFGFTQAGRRRDYYRNPVEDAFIMTRYLDSSALAQSD